MNDPSKGAMRAVRVHDWGTAPVVEEVPRPEVAEGDTLVKVRAAAVAHLDRTVASGNFGIKPDLPYIGGVEGAGVVVESDRFVPGTPVMLRGGGLGLTRDGTWAEYVGVRSRHLTPLPEGMPAPLGATYFVPLSTAATALESIGRLGAWPLDGVAVASDEVVMVTGAAGAVGSLVAQLALRAGARVIGLVGSEAAATRLAGGVESLIATDQAVAARLRQERPATLLVDTLGGPALAERMHWVRPGGRAVAIGYVLGESLTVDLPNWLLQDVALLPVNMIRRTDEARARADRLAPLLVSGELTLGVQRFDLGDAADALAMLASGGLAGRAVLIPEEN